MVSAVLISNVVLRVSTTHCRTPALLDLSNPQGSELFIDVAPGVDWSAILAIAVGMKQVRRVDGWVVVGKQVPVCLVRFGLSASRVLHVALGIEVVEWAGLVVGQTVGWSEYG